METHDIVVECAKISLDPNEASYEEGYSPLSTRLRQRQQETASSPYPETGSNYGMQEAYYPIDAFFLYCDFHMKNFQMFTPSIKM